MDAMAHQGEPARGRDLTGPPAEVVEGAEDGSDGEGTGDRAREGVEDDSRGGSGVPAADGGADCCADGERTRLERRDVGTVKAQVVSASWIRRIETEEDRTGPFAPGRIGASKMRAVPGACVRRFLRDLAWMYLRGFVGVGAVV